MSDEDLISGGEFAEQMRFAQKLINERVAQARAEAEAWNYENAERWGKPHVKREYVDFEVRDETLVSLIDRVNAAYDSVPIKYKASAQIEWEGAEGYVTARVWYEVPLTGEELEYRKACAEGFARQKEAQRRALYLELKREFEGE